MRFQCSDFICFLSGRILTAATTRGAFFLEKVQKIYHKRCIFFEKCAVGKGTRRGEDDLMCISSAVVSYAFSVGGF